MKLLDVCEFIVDCPHSTAPDEGKGYPLVRTPNIGRGRLKLDNVQRVSKDVYDKRNKRAVPQEDDIIFAREAPAGNAAIICEGQEVCLGQRTVLIRPDKDKVYPKYLVYYMLAPQQQYELLGTANGATVAHVNIPVIKNLTVQLPEMDKQIKIANIISSYDDLIENNQKQIKLLEEAAQRLYKEWFVDLRFPGHEDVAIVDGVPEGWKLCSIKDVCLKMNAGGTPSRSKISFWDNSTIKWYKTGELQDCWLIDSEEHISEEGLNGSSAKIFPKNTIIMAIYASPTLGRLGILSCEAACNQAALCFVADEEKISWQWLYHKLFELRDDFNAVAKGAGQQNISADVVKKKEIILPPKPLVDEFSAITESYFDKRLHLQLQNKLLAEARDRLLPKLMSGEIEV